MTGRSGKVPPPHCARRRHPRGRALNTIWMIQAGAWMSGRRRCRSQRYSRRDRICAHWLPLKQHARRWDQRVGRHQPDQAAGFKNVRDPARPHAATNSGCVTTSRRCDADHHLQRRSRQSRRGFACQARTTAHSSFSPSLPTARGRKPHPAARADGRHHGRADPFRRRDTSLPLVEPRNSTPICAARSDTRPGAEAGDAPYYRSDLGRRCASFDVDGTARRPGPRITEPIVTTTNMQLGLVGRLLNPNRNPGLNRSRATSKRGLTSHPGSRQLSNAFSLARRSSSAGRRSMRRGRPTAFGDIWLRDTGPIILLNLARFRFNGWGGKEGDELGLRLAETADLGDPPRLDIGRRRDRCRRHGPPRYHRAGFSIPIVIRASRSDVEARAFARTPILWLGEGLLNDHTDGHVDNLARFDRLAIPAPAAQTIRTRRSTPMLEPGRSVRRPGRSPSLARPRRAMAKAVPASI